MWERVGAPKNELVSYWYSFEYQVEESQLKVNGKLKIGGNKSCYEWSQEGRKLIFTVA
jgi:hypothetical protein